MGRKIKGKVEDGRDLRLSGNSPEILQSGNPGWQWSSASPSTACTWSSALPAELAPVLWGPLGPQLSSSHTCPCGVAAVVSQSAVRPRGKCCGEQCVNASLVVRKVCVWNTRPEKEHRNRIDWKIKKKTILSYRLPILQSMTAGVLKCVSRLSIML